MWQVNILSMADSVSMFLLLYSEEGVFGNTLSEWQPFQEDKKNNVTSRDFSLVAESAIAEWHWMTETQWVLRAVNDGTALLFWQTALLSDADHWTINLSICFLHCAFAFFHTPAPFLLANPPSLSHFSFLFWFGSHLSQSSLFSDFCTQFLYLNHWGQSKESYVISHCSALH